MIRILNKMIQNVFQMFVTVPNFLFSTSKNVNIVRENTFRWLKNQIIQKVIHLEVSSSPYYSLLPLQSSLGNHFVSCGF